MTFFNKLLGLKMIRFYSNTCLFNDYYTHKRGRLKLLPLSLTLSWLLMVYQNIALNSLAGNMVKSYSCVIFDYVAFNIISYDRGIFPLGNTLCSE